MLMKMLTAAALLSHIAQAPAQSPPTAAPPPIATAAISGVVIDGVSKEPLEDVAVALNFVDGKTSIRQQHMTDEKGRFVFVNLPAGDRYTLTASAPGFVDGGFSRDPLRPASTLTNIALIQDQWVSDLSVAMWRPGAIAGRVVDELGEPVVGVFVRALRRARAGGRDVFAAGPLTATDDTGAYRISNLDPGQYVISVPSVLGQTPTPANSGTSVSGRYPWPASSSAGSRPVGYAAAFYPSASAPADAQLLEITAAKVRTGVDVTLRPVPLFRVAGTVANPPYPLSLRLVPEGSETLGIGGDAAETITAADGSFVFDNVPAGTYTFETGRNVITISTRRPAGALFGELSLPIPPRGSNGPFGSSTSGLPMSAASPDLNLAATKYSGQSETTSAFLARTVVTVGPTDVTGLVVPLEAAASVSGRVTWEPDPDKPDLKPTSFDQFLTLEPAGRNPNQLRMVDTNAGVFSDTAINPGEYFIRKRGAVNAWVIKSVTVGGSDKTWRPVDFTGAIGDVVVTLTSRVGTISGAVKENDAIVIAFPTDPSQWNAYGFNPANIRVTDTATNGSYALTQLPAGDYFVIALEPSHRLDWLEPGFFAAAATRAARVSLGWGETKNASLTIATVRR
jgi:hypothetical protein